MKNKIMFIPSAWSNELVFVKQIAEFKDDYEIIVPDINKLDNINEMATYIVNHYQDIDCLIGLSLGGFVVQQILIEYPSYVNKGILIGTHAHAINNNDRAMYLDIIKQVQHGKLTDYCQMFAEVVTCTTSHENKELMEYVKKIPLLVGAETCINHHKAALSFTDKTANLHKIIADVLIICSKEDNATPVSFHEVLHQNIPNSQLTILPNGGHFVVLEQPDAVNHEIKRWLNSQVTQNRV